MSYNKDPDDVVFPTRTGDAVGSALERKEIDNAGGPHVIATRVKELPDGTLLAKMRGGFPDFKFTKREKFCPIYETAVEYGFVDTNYNVNGIGDSLGGPLQNLIDETGQVDTGTKLIDNHAWKEKFFVGVSSERLGTSDGGLPSNYSGLMRRVMQVMYGIVAGVNVVGEEEAPAGASCQDNTDAVIGAFSCRFIKTHGLYINSAGKRWVIEISPDGVFRTDITFVNEFVSDNVGLVEDEIFAASATYQEANNAVKDYWTIKEIDANSRTQIGPAPTCYADGYSPWYAWCGWAFNYTGRAATIVVAKTHDTEPSWYQTIIVDVAITESNGIPSYVVVTESSPAPLASPVNDSIEGGVAAIQVAQQQPGVCATLSIYSPVSTGDIHSPLFSFYTEAGVKNVYYMDRYTAHTNPYSFITNGYPETRHIGRVGTTMVGSSPNTSPDYEPHYDPTGEDGYDVTLPTQMSGIFQDNQTGTFSGGFGFSGTSYGTSHNVDKNVSRSYSEYSSGAAGWNTTGAGNGIYGASVIHWSYLAWTQDGIGYQWYDRLGDLGNSYGATYYATRMTMRDSTSAPSHQVIVVHDATVVISGYDRESFAIAYTRYDSNSAYTTTTTYSGYALNTGEILYARENGSDPGQWANFMGAEDWWMYTVVGGQAYVSHVVGTYDVGALAGMVGPASYLWDNVNGGFQGSTVPVANYTTYIPASSTQTRELWVYVGGNEYTSQPEDTSLHFTYIGGATFWFTCGSSAFKNRAFHATDISAHPECENIGQCLVGAKSLFGFVGVF